LAKVIPVHSANAHVVVEDTRAHRMYVGLLGVGEQCREIMAWEFLHRGRPFGVG